MLFLPPCASEIVRLNPLSHSQWEDLISPWVDRTVMLTQQMIAKVKTEQCNGLEINKIILIGGSSRLPQVMEKLKEICEIEPTPVQDIDVAVANGAAMFANQDVEVQQWFCIHCGTELGTDQPFCIHCGKPNFKYNYCFDDL